MWAPLRRMLVIGGALVSALASAAPAAEERFAASTVQADFKALYDGLREAQYDLFAHVSRRELDRAFQAQMKTMSRAMTPLETRIAFQKFVARVRIAHTRIDFPSNDYRTFLEQGGRVFPLEVRIDNGRVFVVANKSGLPSIAPGDEITALNGRPMRTWLDRLSAHISGDTPYLVHSIIEYRLPGLLWLEIGQQDSFEVGLKRSTGETIALHVQALTQKEQAQNAAAQPKPFTLDDQRTARMLDGGIAYLRPGPFYNDDPKANMWDNAAFVAFIDGAFRDFIAADAKALVIDMRNNPGGDGSFSDHMVSWFANRPFKFVKDFRIRVSSQTIASNQKRMTDAQAAGIPDKVSPQFAQLLENAPTGSIVSFPVPMVEPRTGQRFRGEVFALVDRYSYSNTVNVAAIIQDYRFGTVLGEPTTDMATTYGAMEQFTLPRTGIKVGYAKALLIRPNGSLRSEGVTPDILIATPLVQATDIVLDRALEIVRKRVSGTGRVQSQRR